MSLYVGTVMIDLVLFISDGSVAGNIADKRGSKANEGSDEQTMNPSGFHQTPQVPIGLSSSSARAEVAQQQYESLKREVLGWLELQLSLCLCCETNRS